MNKTILVTAFDPFGGEEINPAWETCKLLKNKIAEYDVIKLQIPTVFGKAANIVTEKIKELEPSYVIMLGEAGGRAEITAEKIAVNYNDARIADNDGVVIKGKVIESEGPDGIFTNIDIEHIISELKEDGLKIKISLSAGAFVCNDTFYRVARFAHGKGIKYDFIHVPFLPIQAKNGEPSMEQEEMVHTINRFLEVMTEK